MNRPTVAWERTRSRDVDPRRSCEGAGACGSSRGVAKAIFHPRPSPSAKRRAEPYNGDSLQDEGDDMSRRLRERHLSLLQDEVCAQPVKRSGSFRVALCYPNLYFVGMSNL